MELTWLGHTCFRIKGRDATVITDPASKETGYNIGKQAANIVTISRTDSSNNAAAVTGSPKVINAPGEYEIGGVLVTGVRTASATGKNTSYIIEVDGVRICHLGEIGSVPTQEEIESLRGPDILLVPVGGSGALDAPAAAKAISLLEPKVVVPMRYATGEAKAPLDTLDHFLKEMGLKDVQPELKITANRGGISGESRTVVLEPRG